MTSTHDHADENAEPVSDEVHENSWSANLELPEHAADRDRLVAEAIAAVERTAPGYHVNLVTHEAHGHPADYLYDELEAAFEDLEYEHVDQCGCGGHVVRVQV